MDTERLWTPVIDRRRLLQAMGMSVAAATLGGLGACTQDAPAAMVSQTKADGTDDELLKIALRAVETTSQIRPGTPTDVTSYAGEVVQGDPASLAPAGDSYLGPTLRLRHGQRVQVEFTNELSRPTNIHWHGLIVPPDADGHPRDVVAPGGVYRYEFEVRNRPGTYWYHAHPHGETGFQAYSGLAGLVVVSDAAEEALGLPSGEQDVALVLQDRTLDSDNQLVYQSGGMTGMMDQMMGFLGETMVVNGKADYVLSAATAAYRVRVLNGSNSRIYKLAWEDGTPMTVIGTDGGLLAAPREMGYVMLAPGQRVELWADFTARTPGSELKLVSLAYRGVEAGMMTGMMEVGVAPANGEPLTLMTWRFEREGSGAAASLPAQLGPLARMEVSDAVNADAPRRFALGMEAMVWTINGRTFEMDEVANDETVRLGDTEVWEFVNELGAAGEGMGGHMNHGDMNNGGGMMQGGDMMGMTDFMAHPMHIHGVQFQVAGREINDDTREGWATVRDGFVDEGWHDTVLVMPGERVKVLARFDSYPGVYLYHCHNMEHEDMGMMRNYLIEA